MEQKLLHLINQEWTGAKLDQFMATMSSFDFWTVPIIIAVLLLFGFGGFKMRAMLIVIGVVVGISDGVVSHSLKKIVHRPRPREALANVRVVDLRRAKLKRAVVIATDDDMFMVKMRRFGSWLATLVPRAKIRMSRPDPRIEGHSFPSSHTMNNFCIAVVMLFFYRWLGWVWMVIAAIVGYSRIYVGAHWPSDVAISAVLAIGLALLLLSLFELLWRKLAPRMMPAIFARHPTLFAENHVIAAF